MELLPRDGNILVDGISVFPGMFVLSARGPTSCLDS